MTSNPAVGESLKLTLGAVVQLYELDGTPIGQPVMRFTPNVDDDEQVSFNGNPYAPIFAVSSGWEATGTGPWPKPKLQVFKRNATIQALANLADQLVGLTVTRIRTYARFLDGWPDADGEAVIGRDRFVIDQLGSNNKLFIEFILASPMDLEGRKLPARQVLRDFCPWRYRRWTGSAFDYTNVQCPYTGTAYFDGAGNGTTADKDDCGRHDHDCGLRFGDGERPFGGFPGVARARTGR